MKGIITLRFLKIGNKAVKTKASKVVGKYSDGIKGRDYDF